MILCLNTDYNYMGASISVVMYTSSSDVCEEVKRVISRGYEAAMEAIMRHGGCEIKSEQPLKIVSKDGFVEVILEPKNFVAKMFWREAVNRVREVCR